VVQFFGGGIAACGQSEKFEVTFCPYVRRGGLGACFG